MKIGEFIFSRVTLVLLIVMVLSIPVLCRWPLFHVNAGKVSSIIEDTVKEKSGEKYHSVWFEYNGHSKHEEYSISSKHEMMLYDKLCNGTYMKESAWLMLIYMMLWAIMILCISICWLEDFFTDDLCMYDKDKLGEFYVKVIKSILKFLGHDPEKVENLELTIKYDKRLSFIGCFTQLVHSLQKEERIA